MNTSRSHNQRIAPVSSEDVLALLIRLARPGARLRSISAGGTIAGRRPEAGHAERPAAVLEAVIDAARAAGYVTAGDDGQSEVLSHAGRAAVREALMLEGAAYGRNGRTVKPASRRSRLLADAASRRPIERMALIEQLAQRADGRGRPLLDETQLCAGLRFAQDFAIAQMQPRITARWSAEATPERRRRSAPGQGVEVAVSTAAARTRVRAALAALGGDLAGVGLDVCCFERGLESIEASRHWQRGTARVVLAIALSRLAEHYGLISPPVTAHSAVRQWGAGDFKPNADAWTGPSDR